VLLLHQTPRSWDEFRDVLPLLGRHYVSSLWTRSDTATPIRCRKARRRSKTGLKPRTNSWLRSAGVGRAAIIGHHTGAAIGVEVAAAYPKHVAALVLSASPYVDEARRMEAKEAGHVIDYAVPRIDGGHLAELWSMRQPFYPSDRVDLMERFIVDALKAGSRAAEGHRVVDRYEMETRLPLVRCPTLVIAPTADPHAHPHAPKVAAAITGSTLVTIEDGMVPLPDQKPEEFTDAIRRFLAAQPIWSS